METQGNFETENQKFLRLAGKYESLIEQLKNVKEEMNTVMADIGINNFVQDIDGTVYQVVVPQGRFVHFDAISYIRTRKEGEERGDLSLKKAEEAGYDVSHLKKAKG